MGETIARRIMDANTAKKAWDILEEKEFETIEEYYGRIKEIVNKMKLYEKEIKEKRVVEKILSTLSVNKLIGLLGVHEARLNIRVDTNSVENAFQSKLKLQSRNKDNGGKKNAGEYSRNKDSRNFSGNKKDNYPSCGICNKPGHAKKDCWHRGKPICHYNNKPGHVEKYCRNKNKHQANFAEEHNQEQHVFYANQESCDNGDGSWYLDSGCSNHMAKDRSIFKDIDNSVRVKVQLGNGIMVESQGKGTIMVETKKGTRLINDVYYIWYKTMKKSRMIGYTDSDWAGSIDDMKSTSGYAFSLGSGFFSWASKKQATVAQSTAEAEYIAAGETTSQAIWLWRILEEMSEQQDGLTVIYCDNRSAIAMTKNPVHHQKTKHIAFKYHFIREAETTKQIQLVYCSTEDQVADIFTKALPRAKFEQLQTMLRVTKICIKEEC
uniref:Retrovirus-related Pol polyprotein from transposon TNT 1-94 n=1 Tax=Cajanus cajan TaxID=3821 RepID=A0A151SR57_CAJCA|nr:Retrovirus-related Pol polyprotein from transposon TNT 1-94 [Cajanus cajan]